MKISDSLARQPYQFSQKGLERSTLSQQTSSFSQENTINFTTKEGDKVSISQSFSTSFAQMQQSETNAQGSKQTMSASFMQNESVSLQVDGNLNEEELADIAKLMENLYSIASDYFNNDQSKVIDGISELSNDMGSIANLSASFYQTQMITSYQSSVNNSFQPPTPSISDETNKAIAGLQNFAENDSSESGFVSDILKAQWQQISAMLDLYNSEMSEENATVPEPNTPAPLLVGAGISALNDPEEENHDTKGHDHATKMMDQIANTVADHPRLSPFTLPLADIIIDKAAEMSETSDPSQLTALNHLKSGLTAHFNNWLFS